MEQKSLMMHRSGYKWIADYLGLDLQSRSGSVVAVTMAVITGQESTWANLREFPSVDNDDIDRLYKFGRQMNYDAILGNRPSDPSQYCDMIRFRGSFLCHLTGRDNFTAVLPGAISRRLHRLPIMSAECAFAAMKAKFNVLNLTNDDIQALHDDAHLGLLVFDEYLRVRTGYDAKSLSLKYAHSPSRAMQIIVKAIGYPPRDYHWPNGAITRGVDYTYNKVGKIYKMLQS